MNPDYSSSADKCAHYSGSDCSLYYELRGLNNDDKYVVLIMGAFATLRHYDELADKLSTSGYQVLTYDHRGIGKSTASDIKLRQTSTMLANDCLALIDQVFGPSSVIHVYGASMGGCIAQYVALSLHRQRRLQSLYLAVTSRGSYLRLPMPQSIWKFIVKNFLVKSSPRAMIEYLVPKCFDKDFLESIDERTSKSMKDRWIEKWTLEYSDWFSFSDLDATASQCSVFATHYISDKALRELIKGEENRARCYITVHIAEADELMPPAKQKELGTILQAHIISFQGGHMGGEAEKARFYEGLLHHLRESTASHV